MRKIAAYLLRLSVIAAALLPIHSHAAPGDLYVSDFGSGNIYKYTPSGTRTSFAGLDGPRGLAFDRLGDLYIAEAGTGSVWRYHLAFGTGSPFYTDLGTPSGIAFDGSGNLFVADTFGDAIYKITPDGTRTTFTSQVNDPEGLAFDRLGNLFVVDSGSGRILRFTPSGARSIFASGLNAPRDLAFDKLGNLYVTNAGTDEILKFTRTGARSVYAGELFGPFGLAFDGDGNLFEASFGFHTIYKFTPAKEKTTFASGLNNPTFLAFEPNNEKLRNISTRGFVGTGSRVLIAGFIVGGNALVNNLVLIRALGPSLESSGVNDALQNPTLELRTANGVLIASNNNWQDTQQARIEATGVAPTDPREAALVTALPSGTYTAIVSGAGGTTGVALVELYDIR